MGDERHRSFSENLARLCARRSSVSEICRRIDINRQQFGRYLSGASLPSPHNMLKIAAEFGVPSEDLFLPPPLFAARHGAPGEAVRTGTSGRFGALLNEALPGNARGLRRLRGFYHSHFLSPARPGMVMRALVSLHERDGLFWTKSIERSGGGQPVAGRMISKYEGVTSLINGRLFVLEFETQARDALVETVLFVPRRREMRHLYGMTFGISSEVHDRPFASPIVWAYLGQVIDPRPALESVGAIPLASRQLDDAVRSFMARPEGGAFAIDIPQG